MTSEAADPLPGRSRAEPDVSSTLFTGAEAVALSDHLLAIHSAATLPGLLEATARAASRFVDADHWGVGYCDPRNRSVLGINSSDALSPTRHPAIVTHSHESALLRYWLRTKEHDRIIRLSDARYSGWEGSTIYNELFRPSRLRQQLGTWLRAGGGHHLEMGFYREGNLDFSARDMGRLGLLRQHVLAAYKRCLTTVPYAQRGEYGSRVVGGGTGEGRLVAMHPTRLSVHLDSPGRTFANAPALTPRESEVLHWVAQGKTNPEIAMILGSSWRTVQKHVEHLFKKLSVETRTAAALRAQELGLV